MRRGQRYGTLLCDLERHRPVDLLNDRNPETVATWLQQHPEIEVITRNRASCFSEGASTGAPQAIQVADRFHLMQNQRHVLVRMLERRYRELRCVARDVSALVVPTPSNGEAPVSSAKPRKRRLPRPPTLSEVRRARRMQRFDQVVELHRQGVSHRDIAMRLGIHRETVARYIHAGHLPERASGRYASKADPYAAYLQMRWAEGCWNAAQLARELWARGFTGSYCSVQRRMAHRRQSEEGERCEARTSMPSVGRPPSANRLAALLLKDPACLPDQDKCFVTALFQRCPDVAAGASLTRDFATMVRQLRGDLLDSWIRRASDRAVPRELRKFATGLKSDFEAVREGLTSHWSNAQLEGQVNRLKLIKRQMYGRAKLDLLRQRVLHNG